MNSPLELRVVGREFIRPRTPYYGHGPAPYHARPTLSPDRDTQNPIVPYTPQAGATSAGLLASYLAFLQALGIIRHGGSAYALSVAAHPAPPWREGWHAGFGPCERGSPSAARPVPQ